MAVKEGDIIEAFVTQIENFGVWIECDGKRGLVNIPEIRWTPIGHPSDVFTLGQRVRVQVLRATPDHPFSASIRVLHPELNPWRDPSLFPVEEVFEGKVARVMNYGCFVEIAPHVWGFLHRDHYFAEYEVGQTILVRLIEVDVGRHRIILRPEISETGCHVVS